MRQETKKDGVAAYLEEYRSTMMSSAFSILHNYHLAEEAVQESMLRIFCTYKELYFDYKGQEKLFASRVAKHCALNMLKDKNQKKLIPTEFDENIADENPGPSEIIQERETVERIKCLYRSLDERTQFVLACRMEYNLDYKSIAELSGISSDNARQIYLRGIKKLQQLLRQKGVTTL